jgi:hypothetical protein
MARKPEPTSANGARDRAVVLMVNDDERDRDARIDERVRTTRPLRATRGRQR